MILASCVWGIFSLSLFVVALNNTSQLTKEEYSVYEELTREEKVKATLHKDASKIILTLLRLNLLRKKNGNLRKRILMRMDIMGMANRFRIKRKNVINETKRVADMIEILNFDLNREIEDLVLKMSPLSQIIPLVIESEEIQEHINDKTFQVHTNIRSIMKIIMGEKHNMEEEEKQMDRSLFPGFILEQTGCNSPLLLDKKSSEELKKELPYF